ncbi:ATP-dependent exonuclease SbcCD, C subunit-like protein [Arthrobacter sp. MYb224]|uniref:ATP-binding protein n=1 Tax=Micrococcaceae TaxID=1268 RepID=UPI000CFBC9D0|nr:ATP-binding protein [Arthrobacter sp. MYb224]PQZ98689.1 ATP-dependent exonuclease SbcCD, C subunit-like protein [Arthrobacter sp. MYb224]
MASKNTSDLQDSLFNSTPDVAAAKPEPTKSSEPLPKANGPRVEQTETLEFEGHDPGFRLRRLEILNWGTFDGAVRRFILDGENSLLTGDIGSGKSTVVDAITTLLLPAHRIDFNKAAGAQKKERSLMSYVRGFHKSERGGGDASKPVALRKPGSYTVVLGIFGNAEMDKTVSLALTLWATQEAGQPNRFYSLSESEQSITGNFADFGGDPLKLKRRLRGDGVTVFDTFDSYESAFKRQFGISGSQAMELFHRTVSMKQVENITSFVRTNMLDDDDVAGRLKNLILHFDDLKKAHDAVRRAKDQIDMLVPIREHAQRHRQLSAKESTYRSVREELTPWFMSRQLELSLEHQAELERAATRLRRDSAAKKAGVFKAQEQLAVIREDIRVHGGGRLATIDSEIHAATGRQESQKAKAESYASSAALLVLQPVRDQVDFDANVADLPEVTVRLEREAAVLNDGHGTLLALVAEAKAEEQSLHEELASLQARTNLLPREQLEIRRRLCEATGLEETNLPYIGELLRVRPGEQLWEGAAELALRGFALSLLVPQQHYAAVSVWVDRNNLRGRLVYRKVDSQPMQAVEQRAGTLASKIEIKVGTQFRPYLAAQLNTRFDHHCCESLDEFRRHAKAVTPNGQLKTGGGRHEKDDRPARRDRRNFVLGWDNHEKTTTIRRLVDEAVAKRQGIEQRIAVVLRELGKLGAAQRAVGTVEAVKTFAEIGWQLTTREIDRLVAEHRQLSSANDQLALLAEKESELVLELKKLQDQAEQFGIRIGKNEQGLEDIAGTISSCAKSLELRPVTTDEQVLAELGRLTGEALGEAELSYKNVPGIESSVNKQLTGHIDNLNKQVIRAGERTLNLMGAFRAKYKEECTEFDEALEAADEFIALLERLQKDDLPRFASKFKEALNQNTINEIVAFNAFLDARKTDITGRIDQINESLAQIEYDPARHIQLEHHQSSDQEIREFVVDLRACSEGALGESEQYSELKFAQVSKLVERFRGRDGLTSLDQRWTAKVTDVRNWFTFSASERWSETNEEFEHFTDSGGKSGGQKEKLAYTILAAALAFQFGLGGRKSGGTETKRNFRFVVIDEAFGRGSDASAHYGLQLFKRLKLQLLIVTPLQKIHVIEPFVAHVGFVDNPSGQASQLRNMTIAEYRAEKERRGN